MKYHLMIVCLCSLPVGLSALSAQFDAGAETLQSQQQSPHQTESLRAEDVRTLVHGAPVERKISIGQTHSYRIALTAGQFVQAFVQQKGKEVLATLLGPDEQKIHEYTETIGEDHKREILFIAQSDGNYRLIIYTHKKEAAPSLYQVGVEVVRPATDQDRTRVRATQLVKEARYVFWRMTPISNDEMRNFAGKFEEAMRLWESLDDQWMVGVTLLDLGILNMKAGEYTKAIEFYERSLPLFPQNPDGLLSKAIAQNNLADANYRLGETHKALEVYVQSLELKKAGRSRAITLNNIGGVYAQLGEYQLSLDHHQLALTTFRELGNIRDEAGALNNIAMVWGKIGDFEQSLEYQLQALARIRETGDKNQVSVYLYIAQSAPRLLK